MNKEVVIMDLPGIYSLSPYTLEEVVARTLPDHRASGCDLEYRRRYQLGKKPVSYSTQLMELGIPVVMAVNMMDVVAKNGDKINIKELSKKLGCEVVEISALKGTGIQEAAKAAVAAANSKNAAAPVHKFAAEVEHAIWMRLKENSAVKFRNLRRDSSQSNYLSVMTRSVKQ